MIQLGELTTTVSYYSITHYKVWLPLHKSRCFQLERCWLNNGKLKQHNGLHVGSIESLYLSNAANVINKSWYSVATQH